MSRGERYPAEGFDGSPFFLGKRAKKSRSRENLSEPGRQPLNERNRLHDDDDDEIIIEEADSSSSTRGQTERPPRKRPIVETEQPNSINRTKGTFFDFSGDVQVQALNKAVMNVIDPEGKNKNNVRLQQESAANISEKKDRILAAPKKDKNGRVQMRGWNFGDLANDFRAASGSSVVREVKQVVSVESSSQSDSGQAPTSRFFGNKRVGTGSSRKPPVSMGMTNDGGGRDQKGTGGLKAENPTLKNFDDNIISLIESEIMHTHTNTGWADVAGLEAAKKALREIVVLPFKRPDIFKGIRAPPKGVLLFGPPGTGKTMIGKCVASQSQATFFNISASSLTSKWVGEGEKLVRALFAVARIKLPSVIFIDEIDSLLSSRSESEHESSRRIKTEFLVQLDGVATKSDERLLVLGATNRPYELDEAARRRFAKRLYIALPEAEARLKIVENLLDGMENSLAAGDYEEIGKLTEGYSGADMRQLCNEAAMGPIREIDQMEDADIETIPAERIRPISGRDFTDAAKNVRATVEQKDLDVYRKWDKQFGCLL